MKRILIVAAIIVAAAFGVWWPLGGQHWLSVHTGTNGAQPYYDYWSAFGSVWPYSFLALSGIFTGLWVIYRRHNCHEPKCWRIGRVRVDDRGTLSCFHHHPDGKPQPGHILRMHEAHLARLSSTEGQVAQ